MDQHYFEHMGHNIKQAGLQDLDAAADLFNRYRVFYRQPDDLGKCKAFVRERLDNEQSVIFLAYADGKAIGFVRLYKLYHYIRLAKQWLLSDLFVRPEHRGNGLSVGLIDRAKQWCAETEACGLMLETEKTNAIGNGLYPRCGFDRDDQHNYYHWWLK